MALEANLVDDEVVDDPRHRRLILAAQLMPVVASGTRWGRKPVLVAGLVGTDKRHAEFCRPRGPGAVGSGAGVGEQGRPNPPFGRHV